MSETIEMTSAQSARLIREALMKAGERAEMLSKAWTQSTSPTTGLTAYSLEAPAKVLYPVITPLRNKLPRVGGGTGIQANWRAITAINSTNLPGGVPEGQRGAVQSTTVEEFMALFKTIGIEDYVTFEAQAAGEGFDDVKARAVQGNLRSLMILEEKYILGGVGSFGIGQASTPTLSTSTTGGSIAASTAVHVRVVPLTLEGYLHTSSVPLTATNAVRGQVTLTGADGSTITYNGGAGQASAAASITTGGSGSTHSVSATVPAVKGAVGYAWFVGGAATQRLAAVTTINSAVFTSLPPAENFAFPSDLASNDRSQNNTVFDGFLGLAAKSGTNAYWYSLPTGPAGTGTPLSSDGAAGVTEIDNVLRYYWDTLRISPSEIWVSSRELKTLQKMVLVAGASATQRFTFQGPQNAFMGGGLIRGYYNPYSMEGAQEIPIRLHPNLPPGTILFLTHEVPYSLSGVTSVNRILTRREYYQMEWPLKTRRYEYGVYVDELLQCYFPPSIAVLTNIGA